MKFEEVLPLMRQGKKARLIYDTDGSYWICGHQMILDFEDTKVPTIIKVEFDGTALADKWSWGMPRNAIMSDDWEILE